MIHSQVPHIKMGVLYFIIEELPNPRDSGLFKILYGSKQIALDAVILDEPGVVIAMSSLTYILPLFVNILIKK